MLNDEVDWSLGSDQEIDKLIQKEKSRSKTTLAMLGCLGLIVLTPLIIIINLKSILMYLFHYLVDFINGLL
ncbi:hypothetical protein PWYN_19220 [Paenibacillus wynnii]|uniref:Uncharacterized protein n=1 Tax=Paenibacillus wynnii TaxID=268407 RepID=A0A098M5J0_9BACL|nr:hypothetical protein PWYN_19220 [Paenibacillus wynnii]